MSKTNHERLVAIQTEIKSVPKNGFNPFTKSNYANLNDCLCVAKEIINKHGLFLEQSISGEVVTSAIRGLDGAILIQSSLKLPESSDPQKIGSAITYYRRYTLKTLLAIDDEDDDGNNASGAKKSFPPKKEPVANIPNDISVYKMKTSKQFTGKDFGSLSDKEIEKLKEYYVWAESLDDKRGPLAQDFVAMSVFLKDK